jgi:hypothetical protein
VVARLGDGRAELMEGTPTEAIDTFRDGRRDVFDDEADLRWMESRKSGFGHRGLREIAARIGTPPRRIDAVERVRSS